MKLSLFSVFIPVSLIGILTCNNSARAAHFKSLNSYQEADLTQRINNSSFIKDFKSFNYFDNSETMTYELEINNKIPPKSLGGRPSSQQKVLDDNFDLAYKIRVTSITGELNSNLNNFDRARSVVAREIPEPKTISLFSFLLVGVIFKSCHH